MDLDSPQAGFAMGVNSPQTVHRLGLSTIRPGKRSVHAQSGNMTRGSQFDGGSAAVASISCSPRHPAALQIDPPAASGFLASMHSARESLASFDCVKGRSPDRAFEAGFRIAHFIIE